MRISYNPEQLFDATGVPLSAGRVSLYVHDSDVPLHVYSLSGTVYSDAQNPIILDGEGRMDTVWFDAAIVDIKVEKNTDGVYESVDTYQYGFNVPEVKNDTIVYGMDELADANPELGTVTVVGYYSMNDCGPRTYIWDPTCTDPEDGGCIIAGNAHEEGRWLLLSDLQYLPSSYYGILPGNDEANMAAFLSYPERLGQWRIPTPPVPRFLSGTYTTNGSMSSTKRVAFDKGAKFTKLSLNCYGVEVQPNTDYVCDFNLTEKQTVAHSSWFRTAEKFWSCGACELHQDAVNYFASNEITASHGISNARISGKAMTLTGSGRLMFNNCSIADRALSTDWYTSFSGMCITDRWFTGDTWDFSKSDNSKHTRVDIEANSVDLSNFDDADVYLLIAAANDVGSIDLQGRTVGVIGTSMPFSVILNARASIARIPRDVTMVNCSIANLYMENPSATLTATDCSIGLSRANARHLVLNGCQLSMACPLDTLYTAVTASDTDVTLTADNSWLRSDPADTANSQSVTLERCTFNGGEIQGTGIVARDCAFYGCVVRNVAGGTPGAYALSVFVENCLFSGASYLALVPGIDDHSATGVYDVAIGSISIKGNTFNTSGSGLRMPFWALDGEHRFMSGACSSVDVTGNSATRLTTWTYEGNTGNCPGSCGNGVSTFNGTAVATVSFGSGLHDTVRFMPGVQSVFVLPVMYGDGGENVSDNWSISQTAKACAPANGLAMPYNASQCDRSAGFPSTMYLPVCAINTSETNDMFSVYLGGSEALLLAGAVPIPEGR